MAKITVGDVRKILEDFSIYSEGGNYDENNAFTGWEEFSYRSSLGEDFAITLHYEDTAESLSQELLSYAVDFDPEEHAAMWYGNKERVSGVPQSLADLLEDATAIKQHLLDAARYVSECVSQGKVPDEESVYPKYETPDDDDRRIIIPLEDGFGLVAEKNFDPDYKEIIVSLYKGDEWYQDLALVGEDYTYDCNGQMIPLHGKYTVKLFTDPSSESVTKEVPIERWEEKED